MGMTIGNYVRVKATNQIEDIVRASAWADLVASVVGAHVADPAAATAASLTDSSGGAATQTLNQFVRKAGIHTWAGGAAATDSISVVGLEATDLILVNVMVRGAGNPTSVIGVNDAGADQIDLLLDQNGEDGVTKVSYLVLKSADGTDCDDNVASLADEVNKLLADVASVRTQFNTLLSRLETQGELAGA